MAELLFSLLILLTIVAAMAIGVIAGRKPIQGSCGGLSAIGIDGDCEICGGDLSRCDANLEEIAPGDLAYDATTNKD